MPKEKFEATVKKNRPNKEAPKSAPVKKDPNMEEPRDSDSPPPPRDKHKTTAGGTPIIQKDPG